MKHYMRVALSIGLVAMSIALLACSATSQGLNSRQLDNLPAVASDGAKPQPAPRDAPTFDLPLSTADAYAAIPHRRTQMDFAAAQMTAQDKSYLEVAFYLIDQAIRLRVTAQRAFAQGTGEEAHLLADMAQVVAYLKTIEPPTALATYHKLLVQAITDERAFFQAWADAGREFPYGRAEMLPTHPKVQSSSAALNRAYQILMQTYSSEAQHNQDAFFDYHCALDFM
jgi:hypothetical protein